MPLAKLFFCLFGGFFCGFFFPFHFPSLWMENFTLLWHSRSRTSQIPFAQLSRQEGRFSLSWPLCHLFLLFFFSGFCQGVWRSDGMRDGSVARSPSASAQEQLQNEETSLCWALRRCRTACAVCPADLLWARDCSPCTAGPACPEVLLKDVGISSQCLIQGVLVAVRWKRQHLALPFLRLMETSGACYSITQSSVSLSCSWTAWEDWQTIQERVDSHLPEYSLTNAGNVIRLSPMFCASALISTLLSVEEKSQEQHQKKFPLASKWVLPGGRKNIFVPLTYNEREETNQSFAMK